MNSPPNSAPPPTPEKSLDKSRANDSNTEETFREWSIEKHNQHLHIHFKLAVGT